MIRDVGVFARAARLAVPAVGDEIEVASLLPRELVDVGVVPGIERDRLLQVGAVPLRLARGLGDEGVETDLGGRVVAGVEPVLVERLLERVDLRPGGGRLGLADLPEVARRDVADSPMMATTTSSSSSVKPPGRGASRARPRTGRMRPKSAESSLIFASPVLLYCLELLVEVCDFYQPDRSVPELFQRLAGGRLAHEGGIL